MGHLVLFVALEKLRPYQKKKRKRRKSGTWIVQKSYYPEHMWCKFKFYLCKAYSQLKIHTVPRTTPKTTSWKADRQAGKRTTSWQLDTCELNTAFCRQTLRENIYQTPGAARLWRHFELPINETFSSKKSKHIIIEERQTAGNHIVQASIRDTPTNDDLHIPKYKRWDHSVMNSAGTVEEMWRAWHLY